MAGISQSYHSIQIVTTSALLCFFETPTEVVFDRLYTSLPVEEAFAFLIRFNKKKYVY